MDHRLSEKWIKASIAGTIWAASEIVLGSFLHNLKIPFGGNVLTAIGIIILISISYTWTDKGFFWRAGIICALMKTMSPSAVIFGPMIAIFSESLLLEVSVRLLGRTIAGYLVGSMLAMSWNLFQKIANYIIYYGTNIIEVYNNLLIYAQKQLHIQTNIVWLPIIGLLVIFALFGLVAGAIGIIVGRKMLKQPVSDFTASEREAVQKTEERSGKTFNYSITWLFADIALIIFSFLVLNKTSWFIWSAVITATIIIWSFRYKRALRQVARPRFWIFFVFITLITAFALTQAQEGSNSWQQGLLTGIQMNFRAAVIIVGFSVLGTELYNPVIRNFFLKTSFRNLPLALELAAESLPSFIANIPDLKSLVRKPVSIFYQVISQAERRLAEIKTKNTSNQKLFIITGPVGGGKTTFAKKLIEILRENQLEVGGIISEKVISGSQTTGYDLINAETGEKEIFLRKDEKCGPETIGRYSISLKGLRFGNKILGSMALSGNKIVVIDEVGLLELRNKGWSESIDNLSGRPGKHLILVVRNTYVDKVISKWGFANSIVFNIEVTDYVKAGMSVMEQIEAVPGNHERNG